jgi:hypothetical protein
MKKKIFTLLTLGIMISISASSQTVKDNIDKLHKDKNTADRAAKADVLIHKKSVYDSTTIKPSLATASSSKVATKKILVTKTKIKKHKYKTKKKASK